MPVTDFVIWLPRGHWGVVTAVYLFAAGLAGGAYLAAVPALLSDASGSDRRVRRELARWGMLIAVASVAVAALAILSHLADPLRALVFPITLANAGSWITRGTWILVALAVVSTVMAFWLVFGSKTGEASAPSRFPRGIAARLGVAEPLDGLADRTRPTAGGLRALALLGCLPALGTVYTGFELAVVWTVPLWNYPVLLPASFLASGLAAGVAAAVGLTVVFEGVDDRVVFQYTAALAVLLALDAALLGELWRRLTADPDAATAAALELLGTSLSPGVWLVAGGVVLPLVVAVGFVAWHHARTPSDDRPRGRRAATASLLGASLLVVAGSFSLRLVLLFAAVKLPIVASGV